LDGVVSITIDENGGAFGPDGFVSADGQMMVPASRETNASGTIEMADPDRFLWMRGEGALRQLPLPKTLAKCPGRPQYHQSAVTGS
jgi:hypothetical protein